MSTPYHLGRLTWVSEKIAERRNIPAESRDVWRVFNEQMRRIDRRLSWWIPDSKGLRNYVPAFSLERLLQERVFSEEEILSFALRLLRSLELLHSYKLAHGALHLRNIFWICRSICIKYT